MGKKLLKTFTNNIGFKILAIAFAFILWLVVYNLNDPVKTKTFTTTVTVTGRDSVVDNWCIHQHKGKHEHEEPKLHNS